MYISQVIKILEFFSSISKCHRFALSFCLFNCVVPVHIPPAPRKEMALFLNKLASLDERKLEQVALGREFHISLGRTVPIRVHQIDSLVTMLRQKLQIQRRYGYIYILFKWEVFVNDDQTRTFVSIEVIAAGLAEITKQIQAVNEVYKLHNLPEFYKDPRPHISVAWALGDISNSLKKVVEEERRRSTFGGSLQKCIFTSKFNGIECRIGNKTHKICKFSEE
ncbi:U6 snRNA phosphodiesterase-like [Pyrus ussuriensis x Pyrus communis]|uniref:U6 snRNA phosphodiesterase 1 n=1 Tax=Pyrus ussuriensis x Pyrus communis TaxID=2448454 RepID=A0A5N5F151_9ROSA|nr:U6 snRNA phosphodiesterase-like [Pyrus ussuriensis x Pyrus communis]